MFPHHSDQLSQWSKISRVALWRCSLNVFVFVIVIVFFLCLCHRLFLGQFMSPHHSDQMSQRSKVSRIALWRCSPNVFVSVIVFVFVFVFVIVFFLVSSCLLITPIKCLKGHKSLRSLFVCQSVKYREWVSDSVTRSPIELFWTAKNLKFNPQPYQAGCQRWKTEVGIPSYILRLLGNFV